jgi:GH24 family phage-related lysozyme (muramidase)
VSAFLNSTLLKRLNAKNYKEVPNQMMKWVYITDPKTKKKVVSKGLFNRRTADVALWNGAL